MEPTTDPVRPTASMRLLVIMFTDLVGSTSLKEKLGAEQYRRLKEKHDAFVKRALELAPSGQVLQDTGDGYFISFSSIGHAVAAALTFQWLMAREAWPHLFETRVGLHLGEVEEGRSQVTGQADFISSAIDQASRTMSLAVGGQILMTRTVYEAARSAVREHPPVAGGPAPALAWKSHGAYTFKGCTEPVEVFEVGAEGVAPLKPPPDSEKARKTQPLPAPMPVQFGPGPDPLRRLLIKTAAIGVPVIGAAAWFGLTRKDPWEERTRERITEEVRILKKLPPQSPKPPENIREVDRIVVSDNNGFDIVTDSRVFDMRGWKPVPEHALNERLSQVTLKRHLQLTKTAPADRFEMQARTSGLDVNLACSDRYPCTYEAQKGESFVGQERMKVRKVSVDVSSVEVGHDFTLNLHVTYWNSLQNKTEQWFGMMGYARSFMTSLTLVFPPDKPFRKYTLMTSRTEKDELTEFKGPRHLVVSDAKDWVYWEVSKPELGHVYRLHWEW